MASYGLFISYVDAVDAKDIDSTHIFAHDFLNIQLIFNPKKVLES